MKLRLDKLLVTRGIAPTRTRAQERIASSQIMVDGVIVTKAGFFVDPQQVIQTLGEDLPYVSRGGLKLAAALDAWEIDLSSRVCLDVGVSTGGFSDCMLQRGAARVVGIDSGHNQLAQKLLQEPRLLLLEGTNARTLTAEKVPAGTSFFAVDVSFIAASLVLPAVIAAVFPPDAKPADRFSREAVILAKPQYEAGREFVGKHGIVRNPVAHQRAIDRIRETLGAHGVLETRVMDSPLNGGDGNHEFLVYARF